MQHGPPYTLAGRGELDIASDLTTRFNPPRPARRTIWWLVLGGVTGVVATLGLTGLATAWLGPDAPAPAAGAPHLVEQALAAGIDHAYQGDFDFFVGGGAAVFDCDGDGMPDVYLAGGSDPAALYRNTGPVAGALEFTRVTAAETDLVDVTGAYPVDIDSDGVVDLVVLRVGENVVLRGLGGCRFERANERWGIDGGDDWTAAFSATWEEGESLPTLVFGNYLRLDAEGRSTGECSDSRLLRPDGDRYGTPVALTPGYCTLSVLFYDWNHTGRADLRMANDRHYYRHGEEQLWRIDPGVPPTPYDLADGWQSMQIWGMGIATYDVTGDGMPEVFLTSQGDNKLQTLVTGAEGPDYADIALKLGATAHRPYTGGDPLPSTAWHPEFADVNNDGYVDLFVTKGNVEAMTEFATDDPSNLLLGQPDGAFVEGGADAGITGFPRGRGGAVADFDLDGLPDILQVNRRQNVELWRNTGTGDPAAGHWVNLRLRQPAPNVDAVGAWIEVRFGTTTLTRQLTIGGGHAGGQLGWIHFGLGAASNAEVRVQWPGGEIGPWQPIEADTFAVIDRDGSVTAWSPDAG